MYALKFYTPTPARCRSRLVAQCNIALCGQLHYLMVLMVMVGRPVFKQDAPAPRCACMSFLWRECKLYHVVMYVFFNLLRSRRSRGTANKTGRKPRVLKTRAAAAAARVVHSHEVTRPRGHQGGLTAWFAPVRARCAGCAWVRG